MDQSKLSTRSGRHHIGSNCAHGCRLALIVHVNNIKHYSLDLEDVKHREAIRPHTKKNNPQAKEVGETSTQETPIVNKPSSFRQFLTDWKRLHNTKFSWKRVEET